MSKGMDHLRMGYGNLEHRSVIDLSCSMHCMEIPRPERTSKNASNGIKPSTVLGTHTAL